MGEATKELPQKNKAPRVAEGFSHRLIAVAFFFAAGIFVFVLGGRLAFNGDLESALSAFFHPSSGLTDGVCSFLNLEGGIVRLIALVFMSGQLTLFLVPTAFYLSRGQKKWMWVQLGIFIAWFVICMFLNTTMSELNLNSDMD